jgi:hypothetical protein
LRRPRFPDKRERVDSAGRFNGYRTGLSRNSSLAAMESWTAPDIDTGTDEQASAVIGRFPVVAVPVSRSGGVFLGGRTHPLIGNEVVLSTVRRPDRRSLSGRLARALNRVSLCSDGVCFGEPSNRRDAACARRAACVVGMRVGLPIQVSAGSG